MNTDVNHALIGSVADCNQTDSLVSRHAYKGEHTSDACTGGVMSKAGSGAGAPGHGARAPQNELHFGDNLDVLRAMPAETIDLIYLDPPFNSKADYGVIYGTKRGGPSQAQAHAFKDMWTWGPDAQRALNQTAERHLEAGAILDAFNKVYAGSPMMAYLAMMAVRLIEMRRVLKPTGSVYLHCDPTASHYLKIIMDAIFGVEFFCNEIIWKRTTAHSGARKFSPVHDVILYYSKSDRPTWNDLRSDYEQAYLDKYYRFDDGDGRLFWRDNLCAAGTRNGESGKPWRGIDPAAKGMHWKYTVQKLDVLDKEGRIYWPPKPGSMPQYKRYRDELRADPETS